MAGDFVRKRRRNARDLRQYPSPRVTAFRFVYKFKTSFSSCTFDINAFPPIACSSRSVCTYIYIYIILLYERAHGEKFEKGSPYVIDLIDIEGERRVSVRECVCVRGNERRRTNGRVTCPVKTDRTEKTNAAALGARGVKRVRV